MAGLRFGLALAHPAVAREIAKGKLPYNVNLVTLAAADDALEHAGALAGAPGRSWRRGSGFVARLAALPGITVYPTAANFVLIRCRRRRRARCSGGCSTTTGSWCATSPAAAELAECLRISIGTDEDMDAVLAALERDPRRRLIGGYREPRASARSAAPPRRPISSSGWIWTAGATARSGPASASSTTCSRRWPGTPARPHRRGPGRPPRGRPPHGRGHRHRARAGDRRARWATGPASAATPTPWCRSTRRWCGPWWTCPAGRSCSTTSTSPSGRCSATTTSS